MFSWDTNKAISNFEKHRVSFEEAITIFDDPNGFETYDIFHSDTEKRFKRLGVSTLKRVLLVIYTVRRIAGDKETIRLISARQASLKERQAYVRQ